jgi:hypothetical protein
MGMTVKVQGREFVLSLEEDGNIWCKELGLFAATHKEVKEQIKLQVDKEQAAPKIKILTRGGRHWTDKITYFPGTARDVPVDRYGYRWVSWQEREGGPAKRKKVSADSVWLDTPENRALLDEIANKARKIDEIEADIKKLEAKLTSIGEVEE